jgi:agmatinase
MRPPPDFDVDGPADPDAGLFGLPHTVDEAAVRVIPAPWEGTASSGLGTAGAPGAVLAASHQVDLHHAVWEDAVWPLGVAMEEVHPAIATWNAEAAADPRPEQVNDRSRRLDALLQARVEAVLELGQTPAILGGEHSVALGGMLAAAAFRPGLGVLQIDAHADLRVAYQGLERSHASVMHNLLDATDDVSVLTQVGVRDLGRGERRRLRADPRIRTFLDPDLVAAMARGATWASLTEEILATLPEAVWISFDVDGLEPSLVPGTGTPVPGGLSWGQATGLLQELARSGRTVVGFDLCEAGRDAWDATVAARLLYELAGVAIKSRP